MRSIKEIFGENIRKRRKALGISQRELAKLTGLTVQGINRIEKGKRQARESSIEVLTKALRCSEQYLSIDPTNKKTPTVESLLVVISEMQKEIEALNNIDPELKELWVDADRASKDSVLKILRKAAHSSRGKKQS